MVGNIPLNGRDVAIRRKRSGLFNVDTASVVDPAIALPIGQRVFFFPADESNDFEPLPVRQINVLPAAQLIPPDRNGVPGLSLADLRSVVLSLRDPSGKYLVQRMPVSCFIAQATNYWPRYFDRNFIPDPRQCYLEVCDPVYKPGIVPIEFVYA